MLTDPRILFIGEHAPYGPVHGGGLRTRGTIEALASVGRVTFLPIIRRPWDVEAVAEAARRFELVPPIHYDYDAKRRCLFARIQRSVRPRRMDADALHIAARDG